MYTHPDHTRKGIGRLILDTAEAAARAEGFTAIEMAATMSGKPLYSACGHQVESEWLDEWRCACATCDDVETLGLGRRSLHKVCAALADHDAWRIGVAADDLGHD